MAHPMAYPTRCAIAFILIPICVSVGHGAIPLAPPDWQSDDIVTIVYEPLFGSFSVDNPAGSDTAADAITTFELTASQPFFIGPKPPELFDGVFDVWSPTKAFRLDPDGFFDMEWPAGSLATGLSIHDASSVLTLSGSFLSGGALEPVDFALGSPEPSGVVLFGLGLGFLTNAYRRRI